jgi:hypothetical protein
MVEWEVRPRVPVRAVVLAHGTPGPLGQVGTPLTPRATARIRIRQPPPLGSLNHGFSLPCDDGSRPPGVRQPTAQTAAALTQLRQAAVTAEMACGDAWCGADEPAERPPNSATTASTTIAADPPVNRPNLDIVNLESALYEGHRLVTQPSYAYRPPRGTLTDWPAAALILPDVHADRHTRPMAGTCQRQSCQAVTGAEVTDAAP